MAFVCFPYYLAWGTATCCSSRWVSQHQMNPKPCASKQNSKNNTEKYKKTYGSVMREGNVFRDVRPAPSCVSLYGVQPFRTELLYSKVSFISSPLQPVKEKHCTTAVYTTSVGLWAARGSSYLTLDIIFEIKPSLKMKSYAILVICAVHSH